MLRTLGLFFRTKEASPALVVLCMLLSSLAETIGIGTLLPVISVAAGSETSGGSLINAYVEGFLGAIGLPATLGSLVVMVAVFMVLKAALSFAALMYAANAAAQVSFGLRRDLLAAIFAARWGFFSDQKSGSLSNIMGTDASRAGEAYVTSANVVSSLIQTVAYVIIALAVNWKLALIGVVTGGLLVFSLNGFVTTARKASYRQTDRTTALLGDMVDALANIKSLKSMHRYEAILKSINTVFSKLRRQFIKRELSKAGLAQSGTAIVAVVAVVGIYLASNFLHVPFPELLVTAIIFNQMASVVTRLQRMVQMAGLFESSYVRTTELIAQAEANRETHAGKAAPDTSAACHFDHVDFSHDDKEILHNVTFDIPANAITVLKGPSGAGKTTIIDLLIGFHRASAGRILIGNLPIDEVDMVAWRRSIGYVPQELSLFHASVRTNLTMGDNTIGDEVLLDSLVQAGAGDFLSQLPRGLDTDVGAMGSKLSGGQRQRIALARALVTKPRVLILDEVTSALDPDTESEIVKNISGLRGRYTIVAITHRPAWTTIADRLYQVSDGTVTMEQAVEAVR